VTESVALAVSLLDGVVDIIGSSGMMFDMVVPFRTGLLVE
jgi:hypothetical protein